MNFEDILKRDFRWPQKGDQVVQASLDRTRNAVVAPNIHTRAILMIKGYKTGADLMVEAAHNSNIDRDCLVYAVIFNYRHFVELSLKHLIDDYGPTFGAVPNWKCHDFPTLWKEFRKILEVSGNDGSEEADTIVERIVAEFAKIDPKSFSYRYVVDTNGNPLKVTVSELDLDWLKEVMDGVANYFAGSNGYLSDLLNV